MQTHLAPVHFIATVLFLLGPGGVLAGSLFDSFPSLKGILDSQPAARVLAGSAPSSSSVSLPAAELGASAAPSNPFREAVQRLENIKHSSLVKSARIYRPQKLVEGMEHEIRSLERARENAAVRAESRLSEVRASREELVRQIGGAEAVRKDPEALQRFWALNELEKALEVNRDGATAAFSSGADEVRGARKRMEHEIAILQAGCEGRGPDPTLDLQVHVPDLPEPAAFTTPLDENRRQQALQDLARFEAARDATASPAASPSAAGRKNGSEPN